MDASYNLQQRVLALKKTHIAKQCVCCGSDQLKKSPAILMPFVAHRALGWQPVEIDDSWGLNTIANGFAYTICNSLYCDDCGHLFLDIRFSDDEMRCLYGGYREKAYVDLREHYEPGYRLRNDALSSGEDYLPKVEAFLSPYLSMPVSMLDWGGDTGKNSPFKGNHKHFHIVDISNKPVEDGARRVDKKSAYQTKYDLVVCSQVLEHVPYPADVILDIKQAMQAETILYVEVPYEGLVKNAAGAEDLHLKKKHWHEHINFFSETSLRQLLKQCGFHVLEMTCLDDYSQGRSISVIQMACQLAGEG